jgi:hypothetical protein
MSHLRLFSLLKYDPKPAPRRHRKYEKGARIVYMTHGGNFQLVLNFNINRVISKERSD